MDLPAAPSFNTLSLCAGGGGLDLGCKMAIPFMRTVAYVEREAFACRYLAEACQAGILDQAPVWSNLKTFQGKPWRGVVDCVIGGYPCQPFSLAGRRRGRGDKRHLWPHIYRVVQEVKPGVLFFENVPGHLTLGFDTVCADIQSVGYDVTAGLFSAAECGLPQKRERLFILAVANRAIVGVGGAAGHQPVGQTQRGIAAHGPGTKSYAAPLASPAIDARLGRSAVALRHADQGAAFGGAGGAGLFAALGGTPSPRRQGTKDLGVPYEAQKEMGIPAQKSARSSPLPIPLFPPRPGQTKRWTKIVAADPGLSPARPALRLLADGLATDRARWLALYGNGVVPIQAAYAFCSLWVAQQEGRLGVQPKMKV